MSNEKSKLLDDINDILIVRKIEREPVWESCEVWDSEFSSKFDGEEQNLLAEEYEAIVRKQLQMLQADERGEQALISEIAAIKQKQKKRVEALKNRQRALDIEKERSKKIASLPPPLPQSVKSLLKKYDDETLKTCCSKPDVQMPDELKAISIKPVQIDSDENKENFIDPIELEAKEKMQEEWNLKAKKRFNEALKKDRQKEEYANIMREIQSAELQNRREMAKRISSDKLKNVPCPISDKFQAVKRQTDMEDAAEKLFKKNSKKEHVIEEIEGYQDHYEAKYGKIDFEYEAKMIDCVPSFVKENYEYLLEEESKFRGGKNFSGLDDSESDVLNQAYIETPPAADEVDGRKKIDIVIDQLDKLRSELQTEYDLTVKPLLVAAIESPKQEVLDKAVETDTLKLHAEDKAVEADILKLPTEVKAVETDISAKSQHKSPLSSPFMLYKRKHEGPFFHSYQKFLVPDMHQRDVRYTLPVSPAEELATGSWSASSYCSLPSKHGIHNLHSSSGSVKCDICVAESENIKDILLTKHPRSSNADTEDKSYKSVKTDDVPSGKIASVGRSSLSEYVKQLAEKYMKPNPTALETSPKEVAKEYLSESNLPDSSTAMTPAFVKKMICKSTVSSFPSDAQVSGKSMSSPEKGITDASSSPMEPVFDEIQDIEQKSSYDVDDKSRKEHADFDDILQVNLQQKDYSNMRDSDHFDSPSEYDAEVKRLQLIQQVLSRRIPHFNFALSPTGAHVDENDTQSESVPLTSGYALKKGIVMKPHIYHELSTIQEMDSALTAGSLHVSKSGFSPEKSSIELGENITPEELEGKVGDSREKLIIVSLLDPPDSEISELAKSIHFVAGSCEKETQPLEMQQIPSAESLDAITISTDNVLTPSSSMPTSESSSSSVSDGKIFSSTLAGKNGKSSFLKDVKILPQYFKDVSGFQHSTVSNSDSSVKSHISSALTLSRPISPLSSSNQSIPSVVEIKMKEAKDDKPETITRPLVSDYVSDKIMVHSGRSDIFQPMTPHSEFSSPYSQINIVSNKYTPEVIISPSKPVFFTPEHQDYTANAESYEPLSPRFISASITSENIHLKEKNISSETSKFHPMTPRSHISTSQSVSSDDANSKKSPMKKLPISTISIEPSKSEHENNESFKTMTADSNISSREPAIFASRHQGYIGNAENFKTLSPQSISSSVTSEDIHLKLRNVPSDSSKFCPMPLRFDILTSQSASLDDTSSKISPVKKIPQISCHIDMKSQTLKPVKHLQPPNISEKEFSITSDSKIRDRQIYKEGESSNQIQIKEYISGKIRAKEKAHPCSSGGFVPQIDVADIPDLEIKKNNELEEGTISKKLRTSETELKYLSNPSAFHSEVSGSSSALNSDKYEDIKCPSAEATSYFEKSWEKNGGKSPEKGIVDFYQKRYLLDSEMAGGVKKQYARLQAISSSSSSSENLSDMFSGSKIVYQSTPIKSMEEIMQETGIMEEPDLTLITTEFSCKPDSLEMSRNLSCASSTKPVSDNLDKENDCTLESSENEVKTPSQQCPQFFGCTDTPSMLSFLHHEKSCLQAENSETAKSPIIADTPSIKANQNDNHQHNKFPTVEYKLRTKRLWNNLEEVKKKNLAEERRKLLVANRLKVKEFSKKVTPKRKKK